MALARPGARRRRPQADEALRRGAQGGRAPSSSEDARRMPPYARGMGAAPGVPLHEGAPGESAEVAAAAEQAAAEEAASEPEAGAGAEEGEQVIEQTPEENAENAEATAAAEPVPAVANVTGTGPEEEVEAHGQTVRLQGVTRARFRNSFRTIDLATAPGEGCTGCRARGCVHVTGTLESTFNVTTRVTLPAVPRNLSECQRERVRDAINNVLAPHEQEHVAAFSGYTGTIMTPIDMTVCSNAVNSRIAAMHRSLERVRRAAAQAASDALDNPPFFFDVDLECEDETAAADPEHTTAGAGNPEETA